MRSKKSGTEEKKTRKRFIILSMLLGFEAGGWPTKNQKVA